MYTLNRAHDPRARLNQRQYRALRQLVRNQDIDAVAAELGVSHHRVRRWLQTPRFRRALLAEREHPLPHKQAIRALLLGPQAVFGLDAQRGQASSLERRSDDPQ
jgi:hypothetical protein